MSGTYDQNAQLDVMLNLIEVGALRLRQKSLNQAIATLAEWEFYPLTPDNLHDWLQQGWDHYLFDLPHGVDWAETLFSKFGKEWLT